MPFVSDAQRRWGHTAAGEKALGGSAAVHEWDAATKGKALPEKVSSHAQGGPIMNKGYMGKAQAFAKGGAVLGKESEFMKKPDRFRNDGGPNRDPTPEPTEDNFGKVGGKDCAPVAKGKSLKPVMPR